MTNIHKDPEWEELGKAITRRYEEGERIKEMNRRRFQEQRRRRETETITIKLRDKEH